MHLLAATTTDQLQLAQFIQAEEAAVGINVVIDSADSATSALGRRAGTSTRSSQGPASGADTDQSINDFVATSGSRNYGGYSNPRLDLILANARKATTPKALRRSTTRRSRSSSTTARSSSSTTPSRYAAVSSSVTGVQLRPDLLLRVAFAQYK